MTETPSTRKDGMNDGGPAFPGGISATKDAFCDAEPTQVGMSLRDWFAGRAPIPNAPELAAMLGWKCAECVPRPANTDGDEWKKWQALPGFDELWKTLTNEERYAAAAKCQFLYADALLAERAKEKNQAAKGE